jgi:hypothetical protein
MRGLGSKTALEVALGPGAAYWSAAIRIALKKAREGEPEKVLRKFRSRHISVSWSIDWVSPLRRAAEKTNPLTAPMLLPTTTEIGWELF